ncbi:MAG: exodeoxyribonuclease III [Saprospiraceae bacterium]|nr:exodeoxyribonuclease III [Saprospiraceae bacterium]MCB0576708.1 exodeoxyribonuclease III [Saprospiraceae bacterium]MCB9305324.1 exodeoxyribonuclease III [Lewinellaceae bacterium]MCB9356035.1 exodeoxyribonuclease III [Lewinellaceae bacterium]
MTNIISYNVNGIRSAISKSFWEWLQEEQPDIICLQETKAQPSDVPILELEAMGYRHFWHSAEKKGYSGVATFSKMEPKHVATGCGIGRYDREGRILRTDYGDWTLLNCYFPSGTTGEERQAFKMEFLDDFYKWIAELKKERPRLIVVGDYNIAHEEIDIHDPKSNKKSSGFLPEERAWMTKWFDSGFTDAFRYKNPEMVEYSWWSFRAGARSRNKGWRIDYQSVTDNMKEKIAEARQLTNVVHSDHCPVQMHIDL